MHYRDWIRYVEALRLSGRTPTLHPAGEQGVKDIRATWDVYLQPEEAVPEVTQLAALVANAPSGVQLTMHPFGEFARPPVSVALTLYCDPATVPADALRIAEGVVA